MDKQEYLERVGGSYKPKDKNEIFCISDNDNTNFEIKVAEKIRQMAKYDYDLQEVKFAVTENIFPTFEETQGKEFEADVDLQQTKTALLIFRRAD